MREGIEPSTFPVSEECSAVELPHQIKKPPRRAAKDVRSSEWLNNSEALHCVLIIAKTDISANILHPLIVPSAIN